MRKSAFILCVLLFPPLQSVAEHLQEKDSQHNSYCEQRVNSDATKEMIARSGCCSHHQGVCGCSGGTIVCCDGTYSPSCRCRKDEPVKLNKS